MIRLTFYFTGGGSYVAGTGVQMWWLKDIDGAGGGYEDGATGSPGLTPGRAPDYFFPYENDGSAQTQIVELPWPVGYSKILLYVNSTSGYTLSAGWTLKGLPFTPQQ